ncbi:hypothetical protein D9758_014581 [Tetrapyrgos nigripes]|uniref:Uncharacterized protein n=1 Tax=Tetrapyrgos nigripes TaxID=182062 RepID=A0A8H5C0S0_9AGAR|nr:hypothetical protein D9758_014581 [Tetrapyrgos nigripes]
MTMTTNSKPKSGTVDSLDSQNDVPPPAYSETQPIATPGFGSSSPAAASGFASGSTSASMPASTPTPTPPVLDPYNPYNNPFNNPWQSTSSTPSASVLGSSSGPGPRQPLLTSPSPHSHQQSHSPHSYSHTDMPQFPNYPRYDGTVTGGGIGAGAGLNVPPGINVNPWQNGPGTGPGGHGAFGPTPTQHLHNQGIPYAYYDPRSEHSIVQADARARKRFVGAVAWVLCVGVLVGLLVRGYCMGYFDDLGKMPPLPGWPGGPGAGGV